MALLPLLMALMQHGGMSGGFSGGFGGGLQGLQQPQQPQPGQQLQTGPEFASGAPQGLPAQPPQYGSPWMGMQPSPFGGSPFNALFNNLGANQRFYQPMSGMSNTPQAGGLGALIPLLAGIMRQAQGPGGGGAQAPGGGGGITTMPVGRRQVPGGAQTGTPIGFGGAIGQRPGFQRPIAFGNRME